MNEFSKQMKELIEENFNVLGVRDSESGNRTTVLVEGGKFITYTGTWFTEEEREQLNRERSYEIAF